MDHSIIQSMVKALDQASLFDHLSIQMRLFVFGDLDFCNLLAAATRETEGIRQLLHLWWGPMTSSLWSDFLHLHVTSCPYIATWLFRIQNYTGLFPWSRYWRPWCIRMWVCRFSQMLHPSLQEPWNYPFHNGCEAKILGSQGWSRKVSL